MVEDEERGDPCESVTDLALLGGCFVGEKCVVSCFHTSSWFPMSVFMWALRKAGKVRVCDSHGSFIMSTTFPLPMAMIFVSKLTPGLQKLGLLCHLNRQDPQISLLNSVIVSNQP